MTDTIAFLPPPPTSITAMDLMAQCKAAMNAMTALPPQPEIIVSDLALEDSEERLFPASRNRSARIRKKLVKRFGGEFRRVPAIFKMGNKWIMHPAHWHRWKARGQIAEVEARAGAFLSSFTGIRIHGLT